MRIRRSSGMLIKQIHDAWERRANGALRDLDLTMAQLTALIELHGFPERRAPLKELERALHVAQSTAAGIVARLEQKGMVEGYGDAVDKRVKMVRITPLGVWGIEAAERRMAEVEVALLAGLTNVERDLFVRLLRKVGRHVT